ncbi:hypothetical protein CLV62_1308 [Dysgonomonas alginatilytica]|uniref:Uncharacterized protein n=1 Tax=Dysgonomonas alginatilytica TaxID=1605892 RepID=A0A2V3PJ71_9BACT|nr:hypothetical protein [Dysgonomonas alginatilytica]PXV60160.1 hypothetical protein CLV62_1308 [Dysgonomonas alginatilytica]
MKIPVFATEEKLNGSYIVMKYDIVKGTYIELKGEVYLAIEDAKKRAIELNEDTEPIEI